MKNERLLLSAKSPRERFHEIGSKLMSVSKAELERREEAWKRAKKRTRPKPR